MTEELIQRFFKKECTAAESIQVSEYLKAHPELIDNYVSEEEWDNIEATAEMPEEFWNESWANIQGKKRRRAVIVYLKKTALAACIIIIVGFGFYRYVQTGKVNDVVESHPAAMIITRPVERKVITNSSDKMMNIGLEDKSLVKLSRNSEVSFDTPFKKNERDIWLKGEAYFKVAKDEASPFTVYAAGLATTALGTEFRITTSDKTHDITVKLYKGKVVIQPAMQSLKGWDNNVYLQPGEQMRYDLEKMLVSVGKIENADHASLKKLPINPAAKKADAVASHNLSFNSAPLSEVLRQLSQYYSAKIEFDEAEVRAMSFTGEISKKDSLPLVLKIIGQMNELEISQQNEGFIVKKNK